MLEQTHRQVERKNFYSFSRSFLSDPSQSDKHTQFLLLREENKVEHTQFLVAPRQQ